MKKKPFPQAEFDKLVLYVVQASYNCGAFTGPTEEYNKLLALSDEAQKRLCEFVKGL